MGGGIGGEGGCGWEGDSGEGECSVELEDANGSDSAGRGTGAMAQRRTQPERKRSPRRETGIRAVVMLAWMSVGRADGAETEDQERDELTSQTARPRREGTARRPDRHTHSSRDRITRPRERT